MSLVITPETKVGELLDSYPEMEQLLIGAVPAFAKLRNPILRKTVAKVATLEQAARIGGIGVRELVTKLRTAVGQDEWAPVECGHVSLASAPGEPPAWVSTGRERLYIDADAMLATGEHPVGKIRQGVAELGAGEFIKLTSSFRPAPLIDMMRSRGATVYSTEASPGKHVTYFAR